MIVTLPSLEKPKEVHVFVKINIMIMEQLKNVRHVWMIVKRVQVEQRVVVVKQQIFDLYHLQDVHVCNITFKIMMDYVRIVNTTVPLALIILIA